MTRRAFSRDVLQRSASCSNWIGIHFATWESNMDRYPAALWNDIDPQHLNVKDQSDRGIIARQPIPGREREAFEDLLRSIRSQWAE